MHEYGHNIIYFKQTTQAIHTNYESVAITDVICWLLLHIYAINSRESVLKLDCIKHITVKPQEKKLEGRPQ